MLGGLIAGCHDVPATRYVATRDTPIYKEPTEGTQDVSYVVKEGEICLLGRKVMKKMFLFREVTCEHG